MLLAIGAGVLMAFCAGVFGGVLVLVIGILVRRFIRR
jgi:hypothetical protein